MEAKIKEQLEALETQKKQTEVLHTKILGAIEALTNLVAQSQEESKGKKEKKK